MHKIMLIDAVHPEEMRMVITDNKSSIHEFDFTTSAKQQIKGNIYLAKVTRVEPSLQAAFVEYGGGKQGFLPFAEIHTDYYQIPMSDRKRLLEEEEAAMAEEAEGESREPRREREGREGGRRRNRGRNRNRTTEEGQAEETSAEADSGEFKEHSEELHVEGAMAEDNGDATMSEGAGIFALPSISSEIVIDESEDDEPAVSEAEEKEEKEETSESEEKESSENEGIETLSSEDEIERPRRSPNFSRRYKIQEVIKRNQILLVQVIKEERGNKGVSLTTFMSLAGRYCVLMPNSPRGGGVSRKINTGDDRKRLKSIISELKLPQGMSVIIRTAGSERTKTEIKRDFDYLVKLWNQIREDTLASTAPAQIYEESDLIKRSIRDAYSNDIEEVIVDGDEAYKEAKAFMKMLVPSHAPRVKHFKGEIPLFYKYNVEEHLLSMNEPIVKLKSGGYIVMNPTEALISIDVNSGRSTGERNIEETAYKTNAEAAQEIARQLRLRDLAGLIVIDFIDMMDGKNRRNIERILKDALRSDRAKIQIGRISPFGLLEMSRQRLRPSISEAMSRPCSYCHGTGLVRSDATVAIQIIRNLEKEAGHAVIEKFRVFLTPSVAVYLLNHMRAKLQKIEQDFDLVIEVSIDDTLHEGNFRIEKLRNKEKSREKPVHSAAPAEEETQDNHRRDRDRDRNRGRNHHRDESRTDSTNEDESAEQSAEGERRPASEEGETRTSRRRNRNRRRWKRDRLPGEEMQPGEAQGESFTEASSAAPQEPSTPVVAANDGAPAADKPAKARAPRSRSRKPAEASEFGSHEEAVAAVHLAAAQFPKLPPQKPEPQLAVLAEKKPEKPARKGWWQKMIE